MWWLKRYQEGNLKFTVILSVWQFLPNNCEEEICGICNLNFLHIWWLKYWCSAMFLFVLFTVIYLFFILIDLKKVIFTSLFLRINFPYILIFKNIELWNENKPTVLCFCWNKNGASFLQNKTKSSVHTSMNQRNW